MKGNGRAYEKKSIRKTLVLFVLLAFVVLPVVVTTVFILSTSSLIKKSYEESLIHYSEIKKIAVEEWLRKTKDVAKQIASRSMIRKELIKYERGEISLDELKGFTKPKLEDAMRSSEGVISIFRFDRGGNLVVKVGALDFSEIKESLVIGLSEVSIGRPIFTKDSGIITVSAPILDRKGFFWGTDIIVFSMERMKKIFKEEEINRSYVYLGFPQKEIFVPLINITNAHKISILSKDFLKKLIKKKRGLIYSKDYLVTYAHIDEGVDWYLIFIRHKKSIFKSYPFELLSKSGLPVLGFIVLIFLFFLITRPLAGKIILREDELEKIVENRTEELKKEIKEKEALKTELQKTVLLKRAILESSKGVVVFALDKEYRYLDFTLLHKQTMKAIWGVDIEIGKSMLDYIKNPKDREKAKKNFDRALQGESFIVEEEYGDEKLKRLFYENRYSPIYNEKGEIIGISVFVIDITTQKLIEEELRTSEEKFRTLFNGINSAVLVHPLKLDGFSNFIEVNEYACKRYGYTREEFLRLSSKDLVPERFLENKRLLNGKKDLLEKRHFSRELVHITKEGEEFPVEIHSNIFKWQGKDVIISIVTDITERKKAEEALRESEEYNKVLFQDSLIPLVVMEADTYKFIDCNDAAVKIYGFSSKEEVLGKTPADVSTPTQYNGEPSEIAAAKEIERVLKEKKVIFEWRHQRPDGTIWDAEVQLMTFTYKGKKYLQFSLLDITERKKIQQKLLESEEKYRVAFQISPEAIALSTMEGVYLDVNQGFEKILGYEKEEVVGKSVFSLNIWKNEKDRDIFSKELREKGFIKNFEAPFVSKKGEIKIGLLSASIIKLAGKSVILSITRDITERKRMEEKIANEKERLAVTLRSIGDGVITTDTEGKIVLINRTAEKLTGWKYNEAVGKPLEEVFNIINEVTRKKVENPVVRVLKEGKIVGLANHTILISKDGKEYNIADSAAPIVDMKSNITGVVLVFRDVTEKLRLEKEQLKSKKLESIGILAGGIAHDFNNILAGLFGNLELAKVKINKDHPAYKHIEVAGDALDRATALTKQLLTFAKGGEPIIEVVDLGSLLINAVEFNLSGSNIKAIFDIDKNLWKVKADKGQIEQVVLNLVVNAKQAMPTGGKVYIKAKNIEEMEEEGIFHLSGKYVKFSIGDEGVGISANYIDKIFDPYFSTKQEGSGLGLAIVHSIITKHNGYIKVSSKVGEGTIFDIYLPAAEEDVKKKKKNSKAKVKLKGKAIKVLIVDDEEIVRDVAISMIKELGFEAEGAKDGVEGLEKYKDAMKKGRKFDVIIMDLTIPGSMGGKEMIEKIKKIDANVYAIVSSGYSNDPVMSNFKKYGFKGKLIKPFKIAEIEEEIIKVLGK